MRSKVLIIFMIFIMPVIANAQNAPIKHKNKHKTVAKTTKKLPAWAAAHNYDATSHAYFPDLFTFYDPKRGGYVYWEKDNWNFTPDIPSTLTKIDLSQSRIQILKGLSLDLHPELNYPYYMELYPADPNNNSMVPVPSIGNPANQ